MALSAMLMMNQRKWTASDVARFKPLVFLVSLYPLLCWIYLGLFASLGANPPEFLIRSSGTWALIALGLTLSVTPLRRLIGQPALVRLRRMLGLFAFFYSLLHVLGWAFWECGASLTLMWQDVVDRTFITVGMLAFAPMAVLALTSTHGWMRCLGRSWQTLHHTVYAIAALSIWHFWLVRSGKNDFFEPYVYGGVLAILLLARLGHFFRNRRR